MTPFAVGVVLYHPSSEVLDTVFHYSRRVDQIYLINNSSAENIEHLRVVLELKNVKLVQNPDNLGIAKALNQLLEQARTDQMEFLFLFDQDSVPQGDMLFEMLETLIHSSAAIVVPRHVDSEGRSIGTTYPFYDSVMTITSGMLLNLAKIPEQLTHDESLFIDYVDIDFILNGFLRGVKIIEDQKARLTHTLGNPKTVRIGPILLKSTNHNTVRRYYIARNRAIIFRRYVRHFPLWALLELRKYITEIAKMIVVDRDPVKIIKTLEGVRDGVFTRTGVRRT